MKSKLCSSLLVGLVLLLTSLVVGCGESYTQEDLESKYEALLLEKAILKADLETMQADITYLKDASETLRDDYDTLKVEYDTLKADFAISKATSKKLQVDYDNLTNELTEIKKSSEPEPDSKVTSMFDVPPQPEEPEEVQAIEEEQVIKDLAYIKAINMPYSDDADPEWEGISIRVSYYDSNSKLIYFTGVPVNVTVELYWYTNFPPIYRKQVIMDSNASFKKLGDEVLSLPDLGELLRIPFDVIGGKPSGMTRGPILILTVSTPNQGDFTIQETISGFLWP